MAQIGHSVRLKKPFKPSPKQAKPKRVLVAFRLPKPLYDKLADMVEDQNETLTGLVIQMLEHCVQDNAGRRS